MASDQRTRRIKALLRAVNQGGVRSRDVLLAIAAVPRERFVPPELVAHAWENRALPIDAGQTISQPLIVGLMTQALRLTGSERVLEIGTGSGYQTAILCRLARFVYSLERRPELAQAAAGRLAALGYANVQVVVADGSAGYAPEAPYDRIIVTAAAPRVPAALLGQIGAVPGARLVIPVGTAEHQRLVAIEWTPTGYRTLDLGPVRFVPLLGEAGWHPGDER